MIETKEQYEAIMSSALKDAGGLWMAERTKLKQTLEALREVARAVPGMFEIAELAMPDSFFQSDSRLNRMREARAALPDWIKDG